VDPFTQEWVDGLASSIIREANTPNLEDPEWNPKDSLWVVFDGPVDALWIENMNTVLDDNMTLCLANSERIKLRPELRMLFEVQDLAVASPATVSRCGMVYLSFDNLPWMLFVKSWLERSDFQQAHRDILEGLFTKSLEKAFKRKKKLYEPFPSTLIQCATNICNILQSLKSQMKL
jgi:dynein heavy chain, axonemal